MTSTRSSWDGPKQDCRLLPVDFWVVGAGFLTLPQSGVYQGVHAAFAPVHQNVHALMS